MLPQWGKENHIVVGAPFQIHQPENHMLCSLNQLDRTSQGLTPLQACGREKAHGANISTAVSAAEKFYDFILKHL